MVCHSRVATKTSGSTGFSSSVAAFSLLLFDTLTFTSNARHKTLGINFKYISIFGVFYFVSVVVLLGYATSFNGLFGFVRLGNVEEQEKLEI